MSGNCANGSVFISYRHSDSKEISARLHDDLAFVFGDETIFRDTNSLKPGEPFPDRLREQLVAARVVLVVIGREWLDDRDPDSRKRRIDIEEDWVRKEIADSLSNGKHVVPVLVRAATPPTDKWQLPKDIERLANLQAHPLDSDNWREGVQKLVEILKSQGISPRHDLAQKANKPAPSMIGVLEYFYRRIGEATSVARNASFAGESIDCNSMRNLWRVADDLYRRRSSTSGAPATRVSVAGTLSPYAPLLYGNPTYKRQLHLELRKGVNQLMEELGHEFGDLLHGLLSYTAGQMVIRPHLTHEYTYLGLYESIVRNSMPVLVKTSYYDTYLRPLFYDNNTIKVSVKGVLDDIKNYFSDALDEFGIGERLKSVVRESTIRAVGTPSYALIVEGDEHSSITVCDGHAESPQYLDGDIWVANGSNSFLTRFVDISWPPDVAKAVADIQNELRTCKHGNRVISSFDVELVSIDERLPDRVLSADQLVDPLPR